MCVVCVYMFFPWKKSPTSDISTFFPLISTFFLKACHGFCEADGSPLGLIIAQHPRVDGLVISAVMESEAIRESHGVRKNHRGFRRWWFYGDLMGFYGDLMGFYGDLMGFYGDFMVILWWFYGILWWFYGDFMGFYGDFMVI